MRETGWKNWRKSTYSGGSGTGNCVEVAVGAAVVGVRDSKNVTGRTLSFPVTRWHAFLTTTRA